MYQLHNDPEKGCYGLIYGVSVYSVLESHVKKNVLELDEMLKKHEQENKSKQFIFKLNVRESNS